MLKKESRLIGESAPFLAVLEHVAQIAPLDKPVLIMGERGTGKELVAERIHYLSNRWDKTLNKMNCAALSESLLESELFGHEAGAFTGATKRHIGRFERSDGGSLFLDELASTSYRVQEQLLRIIEYGEFERLGGNAVINVDVRLIAASNIDLPSHAEQGKFRHDLLDRLAFDVITLPPLRERREDIPLLAEHFAMDMCRQLDIDYFPGFAEAAIDQLISYSWPGNIRELKNTVERSVYRNDDWDNPLDIIVLNPFDSPYRMAPKQNDTDNAKSTPTTPKTPPATDIVSKFPIDLKSTVGQYEKVLIQAALKHSNYKQKNAARSLGISYHQLRGLLKKYQF